MKVSLIIFVVLFFLTSINLLYLKGDGEVNKHKGFAALTGGLLISTILSLMAVILVAIIQYVG